MKRKANNANLLPITSYFAKRVETNAEENNQDCSPASTETLISSTSAPSATFSTLTPTISTDQDVDGIAYRGHDETNESVNAGKWKEFIKTMLCTNPTFKQLHGRMLQQYNAYDYTSKRSSIDLIKALAFEVRHQIEKPLNIAEMYSMYIDECKDNAGVKSCPPVLDLQTNDKTKSDFMMSPG
ncbi:hypothetical protein LOD99_10901 [Oopsacas minuta]|uniref:Uncharacterized protein n=1 Tax=Oopsacas minuta TaxID=111878 RepID=A0AAV7KCH3_9METZ|nr:hypothetical protein LOD99_10901 [Oopsacas minuta]